MTQPNDLATVLDDPVLFARAFLKILNKEKQVVPLKYNRVQLDYLSHRSHFDLILKARQHGVSTAIQAECFRRVITGSATTLTLAHEQATTDALRRMAMFFYENLPDPKPPRKRNNARLATYPDYNSEAIIATAGNKNAGRGLTATFLHGSEVAFWDDAESIVAGALQAGNPDVALESTPSGAQGYFYNLCMEALDGNSLYSLHFYPWFWDLGYRIPLEPGESFDLTDEEADLSRLHRLSAEQIKWRRSKIRELGRLFLQEYPEDSLTCFLQSGIGFFGDIELAFNAPLNPEYQTDHQYVAGLDWGQSNDSTSLDVLDKTAGVQVDQMRLNGLPWAEMRKRVLDVCAQWKVKTLWAEQNSMGSTNIEAIQAEIASRGMDINLIAHTMTNDSKQKIMGDLNEALHSPALRLQSTSPHNARTATPSVQKHELNSFVAVQTETGKWRLAAKGKGHDDTVISLGLAWAARSNMGQITPWPENPFFD